MLMDVHIYLWVHSFSPSFNLQEEMTQKKDYLPGAVHQKLLGSCSWPAWEESYIKKVMLKANLRHGKLIF